MNTTTYERAKAYECVARKVKDFFEGKQKMYGDVKQTLEYLFPELVEGGDERIREEIISIVKSYRENCITEGNHRFDDCLAWLEKQAEPQPYKGNGDTMRKNLIKAFKSVGGNRWGGFDVRDIIHWLESKDAIELEKQGEQKPVWSEEDITNYSKVLFCLQTLTFPTDVERKELITWLKKQGERNSADSYCKDNCKGFQETGKCFADGECKAKKEAEQNIEEEFDDFFNLESVIDIVEMYGKGEVDLYGSNVTSELKWLESLRDRVYWKPTEEQMSCFKQAIDLFKMKVNDDSVLRNLNSLYNDLKNFEI